MTTTSKLLSLLLPIVGGSIGLLLSLGYAINGNVYSEYIPKTAAEGLVLISVVLFFITLWSMVSNFLKLKLAIYLYLFTYLILVSVVLFYKQ